MHAGNDHALELVDTMDVRLPLRSGDDPPAGCAEVRTSLDAESRLGARLSIMYLIMLRREEEWK
jgi:hypothetical protein